MLQVKISFFLLAFYLSLLFITPVAGEAQKVSDITISPREKLFVHSNKNFYVAGEIVWFKIYCVDAILHQPMRMSNIAYAELMDRNHVPVLQAKITLDEFGGQGSFYLPVSLSSDKYILRAYTNRMKNFGSSEYFEKEISIVNTVKNSAPPKQNDSHEISTDFFPEGGRLVYGIKTTIGFQVSDRLGNGMNAEGIIVDNMGDTLQKFSTHKFGIGSFRFMPVEGHDYRAVIVFPDGQKIVRPLPAADRYGYVMNVTDKKEEGFKILVQVKKSPQETGNETIYLLAHTKNSIKKFQQGFVSNDQELIFKIDKKQLGEGVSFLTLFNSQQKAVCERLIFVPPHKKIKATVASDKSQYKKREKADLVISFSGEIDDLDSVNCSLSVFQNDLLQNPGEADMYSYLWLTSYLNGRVESPVYYFTDSAGVSEATENLMLTQGWRKFQYENMPAVLKFKTENNGHFIVGKVINTKTGNLVANARCYLTVPAYPYGFYVNESDKNGLVQFKVKNYYGPGDIIPQLAEEESENYRIDVISPFVDDSLFRNPLPLEVLPKDEELLRERSIGMQAQNIYRADSMRKFALPGLTDTLPFFGKAEYSYLLNDYKRFTTMEEVLREYVMPVTVTVRGGKLFMNILDIDMREISRKNMLILFDGVPLRDPNTIFGYDPLKVKKLDVIPHKYIIGPMIFYGVASFETYEGKFNAFDLDSSLVAVDYEGLQLQREFYSPVYNDSTRHERIPDLRTNLYWLPQINSSSKGTYHLQFYTSDIKGKFFVNLQGISKKGEIISTTSSFRVE